MKEQVLWRCFERRLMGRALTGDVLCDVRGPLRRDRGLPGLVYGGAAEEEGQDRGGGGTPGADGDGATLAAHADAAHDGAPLPRPEGLRLVGAAGSGLAQLVLQALVARRAVAALSQMHHHRHRLTGLHVVSLEQVCFTVVFSHRPLPPSSRDFESSTPPVHALPFARA